MSLVVALFSFQGPTRRARPLFTSFRAGTPLIVSHARPFCKTFFGGGHRCGTGSPTGINQYSMVISFVQHLFLPAGRTRRSEYPVSPGAGLQPPSHRWPDPAAVRSARSRPNLRDRQAADADTKAGIERRIVQRQTQTRLPASERPGPPALPAAPRREQARRIHDHRRQRPSRQEHQRRHAGERTVTSAMATIGTAIHRSDTTPAEAPRRWRPP